MVKRTRRPGLRQKLADNFLEGPHVDDMRENTASARDHPAGLVAQAIFVGEHAAKSGTVDNEPRAIGLSARGDPDAPLIDVDRLDLRTLRGARAVMQRYREQVGVDILAK
jgi:hypothetical protein